MDKMKVVFNKIVDFIFYGVYIFLLIISLLDLLKINIPIFDKYLNDSNQLLKFLVLIFACVGIVILNDKRTLEKKVINSISRINDSIASNATNKLFFFKNKKEDYDFFAREIRGLHDGAEVLVTSFDKNQNINYYTGEDKHTEALMDDYTNMIQSGNIRVKQMVHVCTKKEYIEVQDRIRLYKDCNNYSLSAMVGLPIRPYIDFVIINKETVMLSFPNDKTAPYNEAFSFAIKDSDIALQFEKYFDIYWNNDCRIIKGNDGVNQGNLLWLEALALDEIIDVPEYTEYKALLLKLIISLKEFVNLKKIIKITHQLTYRKIFWRQRKDAKLKINDLFSYLNNEIMVKSIDIKWYEVEIFLEHISSYVQKRVINVMAIKENSFWETSNCLDKLGKDLINMGSEIEREQVLVLTSEYFKRYKQLLKEENDVGIKLYIVIDEDIKTKSYSNFIIIDDALAIDIQENDNALSIIDRHKIKDFYSDFILIKQKANKFF